MLVSKLRSGKESRDAGGRNGHQPLMECVRSVIWKVGKACMTVPSVPDVRWTGKVMMVYGGVEMAVAMGTRFVKIGQVKSWRKGMGIVLGTFVCPAFVEEIVFRACVLPYPGVDGGSMSGWQEVWGMMGSTMLFVLYHLSPWHKPKKVFSDWRFLTLAGILGAVCAWVYLRSGSIWLPTIVHYVTVVVWLLLLGGYEQLGRL